MGGPQVLRLPEELRHIEATNRVHSSQGSGGQSQYWGGGTLVEVTASRSDSSRLQSTRDTTAL